MQRAVNQEAGVKEAGMKYLECSCCGFLAAIPEKDDHLMLPCPFCTRAECSGERDFEVRTPEQFSELVEL